MHKFFFLPLLIIQLLMLTSSCGNSNHKVIERVDKQLCHSNAEKLLETLDSLDIESLSSDDRALHAILTAHARYESFMPMHTDSVLLQALVHFASENRRDSRVAKGYVMYGKGLLNDSLIIEGMAAIHHAHDIALEFGDTLLAAKTAFELSTEYFDNYFLDEALLWAKDSRRMFEAVGDTINIGNLDYAEIDILQSQSRSEEVLKFYDEHKGVSYPRSDNVNSAMRLVKAHALSSLGRDVEALALLDSIPAETIPQSAYFYDVRSKILLKLGHLERAAVDLNTLRENISCMDDVMAYQHGLAAYKAALGDYKSAYMHSDSAFIYSEICSREDANRHPGGYLAKYYSEQERIARRDAAQARTIAILEACVALLLDVILVLGTSWVIRWHRKSKAEQQALLDKVAQLQKQAEESTDNKNTDSGDFQMGLTYLVTLCSTLRNAKENVAGSNTEFEHDIDGIIDYYRSGKFFATLEEDINRYYNNWAVRFSGDTTNIPPEYYKLALVLFLRLPTDAMSFLLNKSKSAISTQKTRLKEMLVQNGANGIKYFEALNISRNNL